MSARGALLSVGVGAVVAAGLGLLSVDLPMVALVLAVIPALAALWIADAGIIVAATVPCTYLTYRVTQTSVDMSISDLTLIVASVVALAALSRYGPTLSGLLRLVAAYQLVMLLVVNAHPTNLAITEWVHRAGLMTGGLVVGAAIVQTKRVPMAVRMLLAMSALFALVAISEAVTTGFAPAYPLGVNKNAAGSLLAMAIVLIVTAPPSFGIPIRFRVQLHTLLGLGLLATRSRGAIIGVAVVLFIRVFTQRGNTRFRAMALVAAVAGVLFVWNSVQNELRTDTQGFGSISTRERQHKQAWRVFETDTIVGGGIRYYDFNPDLAEDGRPSSTVYETLAESGYVGVVGVVIIVLGPLLLLRRSRSPGRATGIAVYGAKAVHGLVDLFWVAGPVTLPWLVLGIVAAMELDDGAETDAQLDATDTDAAALTLST